tara:strand:- start:1054 stop:1332 length:279 start_codon:yes stop_codon:yes gene_type:complete
MKLDIPPIEKPILLRSICHNRFLEAKETLDKKRKETVSGELPNVESVEEHFGSKEEKQWKYQVRYMFKAYYYETYSRKSPKYDWVLVSRSAF